MLIIGIAGGSGSGKTTVVRAIANQLKENVVVIPQDSYYKDLSHASEEEKRTHNFDHPDSVDFDLLHEQLQELKEGKTVEQPIYSYLTCGRSKDETLTVKPADIIIVDLHGESTGEKMIFAKYFSSTLTAVIGTHTHVQTADAQVLPDGTGYITDLGMCGSHNGVLGVRTEDIIKKFTERVPVKFNPAHGDVKLTGALFEIDPQTRKCVRAELVQA